MSSHRASSGQRILFHPVHANQAGPPIAPTVASITADQRCLVGHIPLPTRLHVSQEAAVMAVTAAWMRFAHLGTNDGVWSIDAMDPHAILPCVVDSRMWSRVPSRADYVSALSDARTLQNAEEEVLGRASIKHLLIRSVSDELCIGDLAITVWRSPGLA